MSNCCGCYSYYRIPDSFYKFFSDSFENTILTLRYSSHTIITESILKVVVFPVTHLLWHKRLSPLNHRVLMRPTVKHHNQMSAVVYSDLFTGYVLSRCISVTVRKHMFKKKRFQIYNMNVSK